MLRVTKTESGMVRGITGSDARITVYKGIPFAANTSGENRWRAPQPVEPWEGIRDCYEFAPITMQKRPGTDPNAFYSKEWHVDAEVPMSEDGSLALNIWTPAKSVDDKLPVMVWIFGGGLQEGYCYEMEFDGERVASRGVIFVTVAYRLNVFGFMCHPDITAENPDAPGNFGLLDQKAALEWVQRNIANFGGDPDNVTILGQSAGGVSVFAQMCSPTTKGLFHKAVLQSSAGGSIPPVYPISKIPGKKYLPLEDAEKLGEKFFKEYLGVETLAEARKLDAQFVMDKCVEAKTRFYAVLDNKFLYKTITECLVEDTMQKVPFIVGYTGDEFISRPTSDDEAEVLAWSKDNFGELAEEYVELCKKEAAESGKALADVAQINTNKIGANVAADIAASHGIKVYAYVFDPEIPGDDAGSFHSSDLWFTYETLMKCWRPFDGHHYDLARKMCNYWTNFAKTGDPNGLDRDGTPMTEWRQYTTEDRNVMKFFDEISMQENGPVASYDLLLKANIKGMSEN